MTAALAVVDVAPLMGQASSNAALRQQADNALLQALASVGFAVLRGHGVAAQVVQDLRAAVQAVFSVPRAQYQSLQVQKTNYRGYVPLGYFTPNVGHGNADQYEAWKLHTETAATDPICQQSALYGPNRWPPIDHDVRAAVTAYWQAMDRVNASLLQSLCRSLVLDPDQVLDMLRQSLTNMTLLHYPAQPGLSAGEAGEAHWGIHPHKDFNFLTLLAHDPVGGLEVRTREGAWIAAECAPDELVVNVGDMLELLCGGRLVSTPHRVRHPGGQSRYSFPYFSVPRHDVLVQPLLPRLPGFDRAPLQAGAASANIWTSNWPDERNALPEQDLGHYDD